MHASVYVCVCVCEFHRLNNTFEISYSIYWRVFCVLFGWTCMRPKFIWYCYLLSVATASFHYLHRFGSVSLNHHEVLDFCAQWPTILLADYHEKFANLQTQLEFPAPKMAHSFEFDDNRLHGCASYVKFMRGIKILVKKLNQIVNYSIKSDKYYRNCVGRCLIFLPQHFFLTCWLLTNWPIISIQMQLIKTFATFR